MSLRVGHCAGLISAHRCFDGRTTCAFFNGVVHATDNRETHAKIYDADNGQDENRSDDGKLDRRSAAFVTAHVSV